MFLGGTHELRAPSPIRDEKVQNVPSQADCNTCKIGALTIYAPTFAQSPQTICGLRKQVVRYRAHQTIQRAGEVPSRAYTLFKGWACRAIHFPDGRRQILSVLLPGDTICIENIWVDNYKVPFTVRSLTDVVLCAFEPRDLLGDRRCERASTADVLHTRATHHKSSGTALG